VVSGEECQVVGAAAEVDERLILQDEDERLWMIDAKCLDADPEAFFPEKGGSTREAKRICAACPVRNECLEYALDNDERFGIWGGMSERERRRLKRMAS
jgi:WhiB family redox-sensing transcriptional regulator